MNGISERSTAISTKLCAPWWFTPIFQINSGPRVSLQPFRSKNNTNFSLQGNMTSHETLFGTVPTYDHFRLFGWIVYTRIVKLHSLSSLLTQTKTYSSATSLPLLTNSTTLQGKRSIFVTISTSKRISFLHFQTLSAPALAPSSTNPVRTIQKTANPPFQPASHDTIVVGPPPVASGCSA